MLKEYLGTVRYKLKDGRKGDNKQSNVRLNR